MMYAVNVSILIFWIVKYGKQILKNRQKVFFKLLFLYFFITVLSSVAHQNMTGGILYTILSLYVMVNVIVIEKGVVIEALYRVYALLVPLNIISIIFFQAEIKGINHLWSSFIGGKNRYACILIPALVVFILKLEKKKISVVNSALILLVLYQLLSSKSRTGMVCAVAFIALYLFAYKKFYVHFFMIGYLFVEIALVGYAFGMLSLSSLLSDFFVDDGSFHMRTDIWIETLNMVKEHILFGYGRGIKAITLSTDFIFGEAHNLLLEVLLEGGLIAFVIFVLAVVCSIKAHSRSVSYDRYRNAVFIGLALMFIEGLMESNNLSVELWILLALSYAGRPCAQNNSYDACIQSGIYYRKPIPVIVPSIQ